jgi:hypothetical protein
LAYKAEQLRKHNIKVASSNGAGNGLKDRQYRDQLTKEIHTLSHKVQYLGRIEGILLEQLRRRGEVVQVMREERISSVPVAAR